jgi:hypothetical protein
MDCCITKSPPPYFFSLFEEKKSTKLRDFATPKKTHTPPITNVLENGHCQDLSKL